VPTGLVGVEVTVRHRLGSTTIEIIAPSGTRLASHHRASPGGGHLVRDPDHRVALEHEVLAAFSNDAPCRRKANRPPGELARAEAAKLVARFEDDEVVVSLAAYQALVEDMGRREVRS
jgi:hypothetical protein